MAEQTLLTVRPLHDLDHRKFLQNLNFKGSPDNNFEMLMNATTYFRSKVIPVHVEIAQKLLSKAVLVKEKHKFFVEDVEKLKDTTEKTVTEHQKLSEKYDLVKSKQLELLERADNLIFEAQNRYSTISNEERRFYCNVTKTNDEVEVLHREIEAVREKLKVLKIQEDQWDSESDKYYLNDRQIKIIKDSLYFMGYEIKHILDKVLFSERTINELSSDVE